MNTYSFQRQVNKTANYALSAAVDRPGTVFTNDGASGAVVFTLPAPGQGVHGWWYDFLGLVDQVITVQPPVSDTLIGFNDVDLDSVSSGGAGQRIGAHIHVKCVRLANGSYKWDGSQGITYATAD
jgi:hypothetical protein